jgi:multiple sugar transport system substrate-binding protein
MPDVFRLLPEIIPSAQAVSEGLVQPLDDLVPNFAAWKEAFPPGSFTEGINVFNGMTYTFPMLGNFTQTLQFNQDYFQQAGLDPVAQPLTFETFRAAARTLTEQGQGQYFGLIIGGADIARWSSFVSLLGQLAGAPGGEFNYLTGTYNYTSDGFLAAIDLLLALKSDGSISPNSISINSDQARASMPQGQAAMIVNETGIVPFWIQESPDFNFGIAPLPVLVEPVAIAAAPPGGFWWVAANSERGAIAGDIFAFLGSEAGQQTWQRVGGGSLPVIFPEANEVESIDPRLQNAYAYFEQIMRIRPEPAARNPEISLVLQEQRAITPNFGTVIQGLFTGQVSDPRAAMQDLQDRTEAELDRAIAAAQANGAQVSRDDYVFPNWEPTQDYTQADYDALQS